MFQLCKFLSLTGLCFLRCSRSGPLPGGRPAISGASPDAADNSVTIDADGRIEPIHAVPSLHLRGRLARFTEEVGNRWQLTESAVRHAGGSKKKAQKILDELKRLHRGHVPNEIVVRVKAWGGYYGSAAVGTVTLFEFRDQEIFGTPVRRASLAYACPPAFNSGEA